MVCCIGDNMDFYYNTKKKVKGELISQEEFMNFEFDTYDVLGSVFLRELDNVPEKSEHKTVDEEYRFDLISYKHLQVSDYWWVIMEYNKYIDWNITIGDKYKVPNPFGINKLIQKMILKNNTSKLK